MSKVSDPQKHVQLSVQDSLAVSTETNPHHDHEDEYVNKAPPMPLFKLFFLFLSFGFRAWGGPIAQIAMIKQQLVIEQKWISVAQFNRVLAVYQALPGPEATELACYFGMLSRGRVGAILAGLGFILPGFGLMLLLSWVYVNYGLESEYFRASFRAVQPTVAAMVFRAVHKIGQHAFEDQKKKQFSWVLFSLGFLAYFLTILKVNFFITIIFTGLVFIGIQHHQYLLTTLFSLIIIAAYVVASIYLGQPSISISASFPAGTSIYTILFVNGLIGGLITFGGAYTAIPVIQSAAVVAGKWMTNAQFLDGIALGSVLPAPLVIFTAFVGFVGGSFLGGFLMALGMFIPAFSFTLIGHDFFETMVKNQNIVQFLDGVTAGVVGLIVVSAFELLRSSVVDSLSCAIFAMSLFAMYQFEHRYVNFILVVGFALAGQTLYIS